MNESSISDILRKLIAGQNLTAAEASEAITAIMTGEAGEARTAALLTALAMKGESAQEIEACARGMRSAALTWSGGAPPLLLDTCGTGGDRSGTLNISTLAALCLAAMDLPVAKHGNRAVSSSTGSADLLEELGVRLAMNPEECVQSLASAKICFLFAQAWHPAMKYAAPVRRALGVRTIFNLLGPLTNPAPITHQVVGVFDARFATPLAEALAMLGRRGAFVVHALDGLDEISPAVETDYIRIEDGKVLERGRIAPEDFGLVRYSLDQIRAGDRAHALLRARAILNGHGSDAENATVAMNTAVALCAARVSSGWKEAADRAMATLQSGAGAAVLERWIQQ
ncbi:MAG: anthranilate phosphoribosyltransferase [Leptospirales bacterium]|nr:anthranilate phosphoribosyltransferase [Leptospirales bacterium]